MRVRGHLPGATLVVTWVSIELSRPTVGAMSEGPLLSVQSRRLLPLLRLVEDALALLSRFSREVYDGKAE